MVFHGLMLVAAAAAAALAAGASPPSAAVAPPPPKPEVIQSSWNSGCTFNNTGKGARLGFPFCNASLNLETRLSDLMGRLTPAEKGSNLHDGVPRLGVPPFSASEDTHGVGCGCAPPTPSTNGTGCPTTFPNGPGLGASFDRALWTRIGRTIGIEARGLANQGKCTLYFLDPNINLLRVKDLHSTTHATTQLQCVASIHGCLLWRFSRDSSARIDFAGP